MRVVVFAIVGVLLASQGPDGHLLAQGKQKGKAGQQADMATFHFLLDHRAEITRKVTRVADGVETVTESNDQEVVARIREHVEAMHRRIKDGRPIHMRDPLFREIFRHAGKIKMTVDKTAKGVKVSETSKDPYVVQLIQAHADVVSKFLANGYEEVRKNHEPPARKSP